jgi:hypothetical protein
MVMGVGGGGLVICVVNGRSGWRPLPEVRRLRFPANGEVGGVGGEGRLGVQVDSREDAGGSGVDGQLRWRRG